MTLILTLFVLSVALFIGVIWSWNLYVDHAKFEGIRGYLLLVLSLVTIAEVSAHVCGIVKPFFLPVVLFLSVYGYADAVLRFPSVPQLESYFCVKLFLSVIGKTVAYAIGCIGIPSWALLFLATLFLNVWLLPVLYVLAIPFGDTSPFRKDRDLLVVLFLCVADPKERELVLHSLRMSFISFQRSWGFRRRTPVSPNRRTTQTVLHSMSPVRTECVLHDKAYI